MITENNTKYLNPPTLQLIDSVIKRFGVSESQFERFFGIPKGTIKNIRYESDRMLPSKFWHLFYDPQYDKIMRRERVKTAITEQVTKLVTKLVPKDTTNKSKNSGRPDPKLQRLLK